MATLIDTQHEVKVKQRIADVRPWGERTQEKLSDPGNFLFFSVVMIILVLFLPIVLPVVVIIYLVAHSSVMSIKNVLPYRYPSHKGLDPETKKKANGILYIGGVRSESPFDNFKQCWLSDSDLRKHWLIMGSTGSGKSETLKGIFYNALCWGSGFFCADGKADNKLPTDGYTMARAFGRDDDILALNFLLGGKTPQQVGRSRRRRSNRLNPFSSGDADTLIQMGANLLPKAEGDGKSWQEKALAVWRAVITALCYKRDTTDFTLSVGAIIDYLSLSMIEDLYVEGFREAARTPGGSWSYGYVSIKNYLDSGLPAFSVEKLLKKHNLIDAPNAGTSSFQQVPPKRPGSSRETEQDPAALEQHGYRVGQLMPVLNLLDKTYGYIFRSPFSEIDMIDVALHNRILFLLIPSLEKSSQEAENLGKLSIACLRVMMARNLGSELEGSREELIDSKATAAPYPYVVALDELGYYFADGIAVMFAQARSLGISMIAAAQDLEKLTEGSRAAEAGAMIGNTVNKIFMKIDDPEKTWRLVSNTVGKIQVAEYAGYEAGDHLGGFKRDEKLNVRETESVTYSEMQKYTEGQAVINALGVTRRISTFYMGDWLEKLNNKGFHLNRFLQIYEPSHQEIEDNSRPIPKPAGSAASIREENSRKIMGILKGQLPSPSDAPNRPIFSEMARVVNTLNTQCAGIAPVERGVTIYLALKSFIQSGALTQSQQSSASGANAHDIVTPSSLPILGSPQTISLEQALDEHGLPDPLALIRKPLVEVLTRIDETPVRRAALENTTSIDDAFANQTHSRSEPSPFADLSPELNAPLIQEDPQASVEDILLAGRPAPKSTQADSWLIRSVADAEELSVYPRSVDRTVVGLGEDSMRELVGLEKELGSDKPVTAALTMQKVIASQVTPQTIGKGDLSEDEIAAFFNKLIK